HTRSDRDWSSDVCSSDLMLNRAAIRSQFPRTFCFITSILTFHFQACSLQYLHSLRRGASMRFSPCAQLCASLPLSPISYPCLCNLAHLTSRPVSPGPRITLRFQSKLIF